MFFTSNSKLVDVDTHMTSPANNVCHEYQEPLASAAKQSESSMHLTSPAGQDQNDGQVEPWPGKLYILFKWNPC